MSSALADIKDEIDAIRVALTAVLGTDPNIPLDEIPSVLDPSKIISDEDFLINNIQSLRRTLDNPVSDPCGVIMYPSEGKFSLCVSEDVIIGRLAFNIDPNTGLIHVNGVEISNSGLEIGGGDHLTWFDSSKPNTINGLAMFFPEISEDLYYYGNNQGVGAKSSTKSGDIYDKPLKIIGVDTVNSFPLFVEYFANEAKHSLAEFGQLDVDFWSLVIKNNWGFNWINDVTLGGIFIADDGTAYIFVSDRGDFVYMSNGNIRCTNFTAGIALPLMHQEYAVNNYLYQPYHPSFGSTWANNRQTGTITNIANQCLYTTTDIYDENNNLVKAANCTLDEFKTFM